MFKDGVLDMTIGVGFDEDGSNLWLLDEFKRALADRQFVDNAALAATLYKQAGRALPKGAFGEFFVRQNALTYKPPAGDARPIHAVVRLVSSPDGTQGKEAAAAFKEGMAQSDVAYYAGHGRYGSGPDFDRNFDKLELIDAQGNAEQIPSYDDLERRLADEGKASGRGAWAQFLYRVSQKTINVVASNEGNVYLNPADQHSDEFGGRLIYWALNQQGSAAKLATGKNGDLANAAPDRKYRLLVFDGCRTQDYVTSIRNTPGNDKRATDMIVTQRVTYWSDDAKLLAAFLDSILGQQSAEQIVKGMDAPNTTGPEGGTPAVKGSGFEDNPVIR
jgi:hypothetical protein